MNGRGNNLVSMIGGAALGAVAMYLLDPEAGRHRREQLGELAEGALSNAGGAINSGIHQLNEKVSSLSALAAEHVENLRDSDGAGNVKDAVASAGERLSTLGRDLLARARGWTSDAGSWGRGVADDAGDASASFSKRARSAASDTRDTIGGWLGYERESHTARNTAMAISAVATAAAAAGAIYFLDPVQGRQRRAMAGERIHKIVGDTGNAFRGLGTYCQHLMTRTRETASDVQDAIGLSSRDDAASTREQPSSYTTQQQDSVVPQM